MPRYIMFTRLAPDTLREPDRFHYLSRQLGRELREEYEGVHWRESYALLGPYDVVDIFDAPSEEVAARVALLIRSRVGVITEIYPAVAWDVFLESVDTLSKKEPYPYAPGD